MEKLERKVDRRHFLKNAGKIGVYTPPVLMALMYPTSEAIASNTGKWNEDKTVKTEPKLKDKSGKKK